ncbi:unnamed protein product [Phyllotreta striolata]|uniref:HPS5-like beta-propeller domain-containing protein n=1 Tax=Phyllotreta striolata TaxID=444603 RepID=A0A9N9TJV0_PHYSR|nr:unnamed protein product [Phyllotreta striolata]
MALSSAINYTQLREWAPLTELLTKLPSKIQNGLFYQDVKITCIDVIHEFIALGTNIGTVYWFDRHKRELQRLRSEENIPITSIKVISTVDYMVACGNTVGNVNIFQIPKSHPDNIPENLRPKNKQIERYTVTDLHKSLVTALEWSKNGMKLFSGDKNGCVVMTEIDFYMHICKSVEILNEAYEVVQLSYNLKRLLVSTTYRSIICQNLEKWKVSQVGTKDRKILGIFGGVIYQHSEKPSDTVLYCTRPGLRIWISDIDGNVQKTLLFKDLLTKECSEVPLINPISANLKRIKPQKESAFGILLPFNSHLLVTYSNDVVYILDPKEMSIISKVSHLRGVLHVSTYKDEIFILEEDRSIIRLSYKPEEVVCGNTFSTVNNVFAPLSSFKDLTVKLQSSNILPAIPSLLETNHNGDMEVHTDENLIMNAEEAQESPTRGGQDVQRKFEEIGKKQFEDDILYKKSRRRKKRTSPDANAGTESISSASSDEREVNCIKPTIMNLSTVGVLPDLRSPESIKYDIEYKEKILADVLNLDKVKLSESDSEVRRIESNCDSSHIDKLEMCSKMSKILSSTKHLGNLNGKSDFPMPEIPQQLSILSKSTDDTHKSNPPKLPPNNQNGVSKSNVSNKLRDDTPACMSIPNTWGLTNIRIRERTISVKSDESLDDWEIV